MGNFLQCLKRLSTMSLKSPPAKTSCDFSLVPEKSIQGENGAAIPTSDAAILQLPTEMLLKIFKCLGYHSLARCAMVCRRFRDLSEDQSLYRRLEFHEFNTVDSEGGAKRIRWLLNRATNPKTVSIYTFFHQSKSMEMVLNNLTSWPNLQELRLDDVQLDGVEEFTQNQLKFLAVIECQTDPKVLGRLLLQQENSLRALKLNLLKPGKLPELAALRHLRILKLDHVDFSGVEHLELRGLKLLKLKMCNISRELLDSILKQNVELEVFSLTSLQPWSVPLAGLRHSKHLEHLELDLKANALVDLRSVSTFGNLKKLFLSESTSSPSEWAPRWANLDRVQHSLNLKMIGESCAKLEEVEFSCLPLVNDDVLERFVKNCANLQTVFLEHLPLVTEAICLSTLKSLKYLEDFQVKHCANVNEQQRFRILEASGRNHPVNFIICS